MFISEEIFQGCVSGDRKAQEKLFQTCYNESLKLILRYIPSQEDAKDVLIQAYFKVFTKINHFSGDYTNLFGWIKRILINQSLDFLKSVSGNKIQDIPAIQEMLYDETEEEKADDFILTLIQQLPEMHRKVFNLYAIDGFSHKEIAVICQISESNSKYYVHTARKILQEKIFKVELP